MLVREPPRAPRHATPGSARTPAPTPIEAVVVSASHYLFGEGTRFRPMVLSSAELESLPDIGEDPVRAVARLPGVASLDFSSRFHLRGGTEEETLVRFDDLRLYDPYHLKDFFGVFSSIDPAIVSDIRVYTGGFPVAFGDRSSGVVDIAPRLAGEGFQGEAVASFFTVGASLDGTTESGATDWAVAARRGNMDLLFDLVDSPLGEPKYHDFYARVGHRFNDWLALSANALAFDDQILAFDSDQEEEAVAEYLDQYYWLRLDLGAPDGFGGRVLAAHTVLESERSGSADLPGVGSGTLTDERHFTINTIQADGWRRLGARSLLQAGVEWREQEGRYDYEDEAEFELLFLTPGAASEPTQDPGPALAPVRSSAAAYLNWRFEPIGRDRDRPRHALGPRHARRARRVAVEPARGPHVAAARGHAHATRLGTLLPGAGDQRAAGAGWRFHVPACPARDPRRGEHRARPHGFPDPARSRPIARTTTIRSRATRTS